MLALLVTLCAVCCGISESASVPVEKAVHVADCIESPKHQNGGESCSFVGLKLVCKNECARAEPQPQRTAIVSQCEALHRFSFCLLPAQMLNKIQLKVESLPKTSANQDSKTTARKTLSKTQSARTKQNARKQSIFGRQHRKTSQSSRESSYESSRGSSSDSSRESSSESTSSNSYDSSDQSKSSQSELSRKSSSNNSVDASNKLSDELFGESFDKSSDQSAIDSSDNFSDEILNELSLSNVFSDEFYGESFDESSDSSAHSKDSSDNFSDDVLRKLSKQLSEQSSHSSLHQSSGDSSGDYSDDIAHSANNREDQSTQNLDDFVKQLLETLHKKPSLHNMKPLSASKSEQLAGEFFKKLSENALRKLGSLIG